MTVWPLNKFCTPSAATESPKKIRSLIRYDHDFRGNPRDASQKSQLKSHESGEAVASSDCNATISRRVMRLEPDKTDGIFGTASGGRQSTGCRAV